MTKAAVEIVLLKGPVNVAYRKAGRKWHATALEFDLVGIGKTRATALGQLRGVLNTYLEEILKTKGPVRLFNPSPGEEWDAPRRDQFTPFVF